MYNPRIKRDWDQIVAAVAKMHRKPPFVPSAYEKKVQVRAEGLLKGFGLYCLRFSWVLTGEGRHSLEITLRPVSNAVELVGKALQAMGLAFRKATATERIARVEENGSPLAIHVVCIEFHNKEAENATKQTP